MPLGACAIPWRAAAHPLAPLAPLQVDTSTKGTQWGTGGMATKLTAARIATAAGCRMVICRRVLRRVCLPTGQRCASLASLGAPQRAQGLGVRPSRVSARSPYPPAPPPLCTPTQPQPRSLLPL